MQSNKCSDLMVSVATLLVTVAMGYLQVYCERDGRAQRAGMQDINPANSALMDTATS